MPSDVSPPAGRRWLGAVVGGCLLALGVAGCTTVRPDFSGYWQTQNSEAVVRPDVNAVESDYTPEALRSLRDFKTRFSREQDDPKNFCVRYGMPNTVASRARDYLNLVFQTPDALIVLVELEDNHRVIRIGDGKDADGTLPPGLIPSNNGYSVARWEGDTLVIRTTGLKSRLVNTPSLRSDKAEILERWHLDHKGSDKTVTIDMVITDPVVFQHPMRAHQVWKSAPAGAVLNEYGCEDTLWDTYAKSKIQKEH